MEFVKVNPAIYGNAQAVFGKNVDFLELNFGPTGNSASTGTGILGSVSAAGAWPAVIRQIETAASIEILGALTANLALVSANGANSNVGVRVVTSGVGAVNVAALQASIQSLGNVAGANLSGVTVASFTF